MLSRISILLGTLAIGLMAVGSIALLEPEWVIAKLRKASPAVLYSVDVDEPVVALTIDDGPDPVETPKILDHLRKYNAHATFFLIGSRISGNEGIVHRLVAEGHEIGNHLEFDEPSIRLPLSEFESQLIEVDALLSGFAPARWLRPGSGWYNNDMLEIIHRHGYHCALGSVYPFDPQIGSAWFIRKYILWKAQPGAVIVLHDYASRGARTAEALETILPELARRGYRVVTLSELVASSE
jgi:peptidoglycan/xylan/chitin deacetylase (PgdA/CDA1 family)